MISNANFIKRMFDGIVDALFPVKCLVCDCFFAPADTSPWQAGPANEAGDAEGHDQHDGGINCFPGAFVCSDCAAQISFVEHPICLSCGIMFKSSQGENRLCGDCITAPKHFRMARAAVVYDQTMMHLIHSYKYSGKIQLAGAFSGFLLKTLNLYWKAGEFDCIIPVPLSAGRLRQRGFNQAYLLIRNWQKVADQAGIHVRGAMVLKDALVRLRATLPQTGLGRKARLNNIKNAFSVQDASLIGDRRILLVDDVYTTGATVNECARELMDRGAQRVDVLTLARAM
jgi:ComF family protein